MSWMTVFINPLVFIFLFIVLCCQFNSRQYQERFSNYLDQRINLIILDLLLGLESIGKQTFCTFDFLSLPDHEYNG
jgi:hypothetical protein